MPDVRPAQPLHRAHPIVLCRASNRDVQVCPQLDRRIVHLAELVANLDVLLLLAQIHARYESRFYCFLHMKAHTHHIDVCHNLRASVRLESNLVAQDTGRAKKADISFMMSPPGAPV